MGDTAPERGRIQQVPNGQTGSTVWGVTLEALVVLGGLSEGTDWLCCGGTPWVGTGPPGWGWAP